MKITLLLIPLLLLSSCTIDWNDEKDIKIAELEREINTYKSISEKAPSMNDAIEKFNTPMASGYYSSLMTSCENLELLEQEWCISSVKLMEEKGYTEALKNPDGTYVCRVVSKKTSGQSFMIPGSKTWCIE